MKYKPALLTMFIFIMSVVNCHPIISQTNIPRAQQESYNYSPIATIENAYCIAPYSCTSAGCPRNVSDFNNTMKSYYNWNQVLPQTSMIIVENDGYLLRFKWDSKKLLTQTGSSSIPFLEHQAWLVSLVVDTNEFASIRDTSSHNTDYMSNLPCHYKVNNYAQSLDKDTFNNLLLKYCNIDTHTANQYSLFDLKQQLEDNRIDYNKRFSVGSMCPEKIKPDTWYFILLKLKPNTQTSALARIESRLIEDRFLVRTKKMLYSNSISFSDCPYLIHDVQISSNKNIFTCGRRSQKTWINRVCVPTKQYVFTPGIDTKNDSARPSFCYDNTQPPYESGDGDGWFDIRTYIRDVGGNLVPITNNMLMHGTQMGDCQNMNSDTNLNTQECKWFNVAQVAPGTQCFWDDVTKKCYLDGQKRYLYSPQKLLDAYYQQSKKSNEYPGSLNRIGRAISWVHRIKNGLVQFFDFGGQGRGALTMLLEPMNASVIYMNYPFWNIYMYRLNGMYGKLGFPIDTPLTKSEYIEQHFEFGWLRKYPGDSYCYLAKIGETTPQRLCLKCDSEHSCAHPNSICIENYCFDKEQLSTNLHKKCSTSFSCPAGSVCQNQECTPLKR